MTEKPTTQKACRGYLPSQHVRDEGRRNGRSESLQQRLALLAIPDYLMGEFNGDCTVADGGRE